MAQKNNLALSGSVSLPAGEDIISLVAHGETIFASTNNRRLYRIKAGKLPINSYAVDIRSIIDGAADNIRHLTLSGDYLFFDVGTSVHRLDLNTGVDTVLNVPNALAINALHYANGHLWIAQRTAATSEILVADAVSWQLDDSVKFNLTQVASSLAEDHGFLAVGLGGDGVTIYDLSGHLQRS